eukprot:scaffold146472_cov14-Tisochrysis_lutea.AAC.1
MMVSRPFLGNPQATGLSGAVDQTILSVNLLMWNLEMPVQLEAALEAGNVDTACFCLRSWIMQAASGHHVGMCKVQDCIFKRTEKRGIRRPVKSGQAVHAC